MFLWTLSFQALNGAHIRSHSALTIVNRLKKSTWAITTTQLHFSSLNMTKCKQSVFKMFTCLSKKHSQHFENVLKICTQYWSKNEIKKKSENIKKYLSCPSDGGIWVSWSNALQLHFAAFLYHIITIWWIWPYWGWYCNIKGRKNHFPVFIRFIIRVVTWNWIYSICCKMSKYVGIWRLVFQMCR